MLMKAHIKILALILSALFLGSFLTSCAVNKEASSSSDSDSDSENASSSPENGSAPPNAPTDENLPDDAYLLLQNGAYTVKLVMPDNPTDTEKAVYTKMRSLLKAKTGVIVDSATDYLKAGESHPSSEYAILIGLTNYAESQKVYGDTESGTYGVKFYGRKIVFYFSTKDEGAALTNAFANAIKSTERRSYWISKSFSVSKSTVFKLEDVPNYPTSTTAISCEDDTTMLLAKNTNLSTFNEYCETLESSGYEQYSKRDNVNGNYFRTYVKGTMALTVYYTASSKAARIISGPLSDIPTKDVDRTPETNKNPTVTLLTQGASAGSGLGMIFHLPNGKFFIYDGGNEIGDNVYEKLKELAKGEEIIIAAWVISHPHPDHEDAFDAFLKKHANDVRIENVMYNFVKCSDKYGTSETIKPIIEKYVTRKTNVIKPHSGQIYEFGSSSIEIIHTAEDFLPNEISDVNYSTMVVRFTVAGQTTMALGDVLDKVSEVICANYGSYLKSDMVQLAHHGSWPGTKPLYTNIDAPILFWPSCKSNAKTRYIEQSNAALIEAMAKAKDVYLAGEGTITLSLPCQVQNNKSSFIDRIKK